MRSRRIAVVGASLAGLHTAQSLRRSGFDGPLTLIGAETHLPYDRPPLSKRVLTGETDAGQVLYTDADELDELAVDLRLGAAATGINPQRSEITVDSGAPVAFDDVVIATGARAVQPFVDPPAGVMRLRTLDDALTLRAALRESTRLVVIGGGFIGLEVASAARSVGLDVVIAEAAPNILSRSLTPETAKVLEKTAEDSGVSVRCGRTVTGFSGSDRVEGALLDDGGVEHCDLVVVGVGAVPNTDWLAGSDVEVSKLGVRCDVTGRARLTENVWGVGDAACWQGPDGRHQRHEHWTSAAEQARVVGANIVDGGSRTMTSAPYVWSDQFGKRISVVGNTLHYDTARFLCSEPDDLAVLYARDGFLVGACIVDRMRLVLQCRKWVASFTPLPHIPPWQNAA